MTQDINQLPVKQPSKWGWKTWGLLGLGGLCLACLVIGQVGRLAQPTPVAKSEQSQAPEPQEEEEAAAEPGESAATPIPTDVPIPTETPVPTETPTPEPSPTSPPVVGQDVLVGLIRWKFLEAMDIGQELKADNQFIEPKSTSGKFIQVRFEMENTGSEALTYGGISLVDDKNRSFEAYQDRFFFIPDGEQCVFEQINPGLSKTCVEIFEVPGDATSLKAKIGDLQIFGAEEAMVDLGL